MKTILSILILLLCLVGLCVLCGSCGVPWQRIYKNKALICETICPKDSTSTSHNVTYIPNPIDSILMIELAKEQKQNIVLTDSINVFLTSGKSLPECKLLLSKAYFSIEEQAKAIVNLKTLLVEKKIIIDSVKIYTPKYIDKQSTLDFLANLQKENTTLIQKNSGKNKAIWILSGVLALILLIGFAYIYVKK